MDDTLVAGRDDEHNDEILKQVINRATTYNLELNTEKLHFQKSSVPCLGHLLTSQGLIAAPEKVKAIQAMPAPQNKEDVKRFLGFKTYLEKIHSKSERIKQRIERTAK